MGTSQSLSCLFIGIVSVLSVGCSEAGGSRAEMSTLQHEVAGLRRQLDSLGFVVTLGELRAHANETVRLTPGSQDYSVLEGDLGQLTVSMKDVKGYANGARVVLQFGNVSSATMNGVEVYLEWGRVDSTGRALTESSRSRDVKLSKSLSAGSWTDVPVILEGVPPTELGFVQLSNLRHTGIRLRQ